MLSCFWSTDERTQYVPLQNMHRNKLDEVLELTDCLGKCSKLPNSMNYFELSESTDWKGDTHRLVLCDSDYQGLVLLRLKACCEELDVDMGDDSDPDPDLDEQGTQSPKPIVEWSECFEKFYISKKDVCGQFQTTFHEFCNDVDHLMKVDLIMHV